jgi:hypothetical protein
MQFLGEAREASFQDSNAFAFMREMAAGLIIQAVVYFVGRGISKD